MNDSKVLEEYLTRGAQLLITGKTPNGALAVKGTVSMLGVHHFKVSCERSMAKAGLEAQQKVKVRVLSGRSTLPMSCRFLRLDENRSTDMVLSVPEGDWITNRRAFARAKVAIPVTVVRHSGQVLTGTTIDISGGGALVSLNEPLNDMEEFTIILNPMGERDKELEFTAQVVRDANSREKELFGIKFVKTPTRAQNQVCKLVIVNQFEQRRAELREISGRSENR